MKYRKFLIEHKGIRYCLYQERWFDYEGKYSWGIALYNITYRSKLLFHCGKSPKHARNRKEACRLLKYHLLPYLKYQQERNLNERNF